MVIRSIRGQAAAERESGQHDLGRGGSPRRNRGVLVDALGLCLIVGRAQHFDERALRELSCVSVQMVSLAFKPLRLSSKPTECDETTEFAAKDKAAPSNIRVHSKPIGTDNSRKQSRRLYTTEGFKGRGNETASRSQCLLRHNQEQSDALRATPERSPRFSWPPIAPIRSGNLIVQGRKRVNFNLVTPSQGTTRIGI